MIDHGLKLYEDGTLQITLPKGTMVRRVLVGEEGSHFCEVMYPETGSGISKEPTYEQVMEYCKKRCLSLVTNEFLAKLPSALPELVQNLHTTCTDAISRQAAIEAYGDWYVEEGPAEGFIGTVKQLLEGFPSAEPERKNGKWTYRNGKTATIGMSYSVVCSECNEWSEYCTNFCPHCGAKMEG